MFARSGICLRPLKRVRAHRNGTVDMTQRILKAHEARTTAGRIAFNFDDLQQRCAEELSTAQTRAAEIIAQAEQQAVAMLEKARNEGLLAGRQEGIADAHRRITEQAEQSARAQVSERLKTTLPALENAVAALHIERDQWLKRWEAAAVQLSVAMAEKLIHAELTLRPELLTRRIRELLQLASDQPQMQIRMHPADIILLNEMGAEIVHRVSRAGEATLVPDESVSRGGCRIETQHGEIDGQIESQLSRIAEELLAEVRSRTDVRPRTEGRP